MALDATDKATLSEILGITPLALTQHLEYVESGLDAATLAAIEADILLWADYRNTETVSFSPTESNEGFQMSGGGVKAAIIRRIAGWLSFDLSGFGNEFYVRTERS